MVFITTVIGLLILLFVVEKGFNCLLSVDKKRISETTGKRVDRFGQMVLFVILLVVLWLMTDRSDTQRLFYFTSYLAILFGYQAIMEWIFIKNSRQYMSTAILFIIALMLMLNVESYPFLF